MCNHRRIMNYPAKFAVRREGDTFIFTGDETYIKDLEIRNDNFEEGLEKMSELVTERMDNILDAYKG